MYEHITVDTSPIGPIDLTETSIVAAAYTGKGPQYDIATLKTIAHSIIIYCELSGLRPSYVAGHIFTETGAFYYHGDVAPAQFNFGGLGATGNGVAGLSFPNADVGMRAMIAHECAYIYGALRNWPVEVQLLYKDDPRAQYVVSGINAGSIKKIGDLGSGKWAAADSKLYTKNIVNWGNVMIDLANSDTPPVTVSPVKIALAAGHHNSDGGNKIEYDIVGQLTKTYATIFRKAGADVRVVTPNEGLGQFDGGLQQVAQVVVDWYNNGWEADLFLEVHTQGGSGTRGAFGIYPDWEDDVDIDARDFLIPAIIHAGTQATGIPVFSTGVMSEKNTGVGLSGYRLGIFLITEPINITCTRMIIEHGAHDSADLPIIRTQEFMTKWCTAVVPEIMKYYGQEVNIVPSDTMLHENGFVIGGGFQNIVNNLEQISHTFRMKILGGAISNEGDGYLLEPEISNTIPTGRYKVHNVTIQKFERQTLIHDETESNTDWQDVSPLINRGYIVGFASDPIVAAVLNNDNVRVS